MTNYEIVQIIEKAMENQSITKVNLAKLFDEKASTISNWMSPKRKLPAVAFLKIIKELNIPFDAFKDLKTVEQYISPEDKIIKLEADIELLNKHIMNIYELTNTAGYMIDQIPENTNKTHNQFENTNAMYKKVINKLIEKSINNPSNISRELFDLLSAKKDDLEHLEKMYPISDQILYLSFYSNPNSLLMTTIQHKISILLSEFAFIYIYYLEEMKYIQSHHNKWRFQLKLLDKSLKSFFYRFRSNMEFEINNPEDLECCNELRFEQCLKCSKQGSKKCLKENQIFIESVAGYFDIKIMEVLKVLETFENEQFALKDIQKILDINNSIIDILSEVDLYISKCCNSSIFLTVDHDDEDYEISLRNYYEENIDFLPESILEETYAQVQYELIRAQINKNVDKPVKSMKISECEPLINSSDDEKKNPHAFHIAEHEEYIDTSPVSTLVTGYGNNGFSGFNTPNTIQEDIPTKEELKNQRDSGLDGFTTEYDPFLDNE